MIAYLEDPRVQQQGLVGLMGIADQATVLAKQMDNAIKALRVQVLVYLAHSVLFLCVTAPIAYKLISLLNNQIYSLVSYSTYLKCSSLSQGSATRSGGLLPWQSSGCCEKSAQPDPESDANEYHYLHQSHST